MKNFFTISSKTIFQCALLLLFLAFLPKEGKSCIDPDSLVTVTANYNMEFTEVEIRLGNLRLMTEQPNVFCSCALSDFTGFFTYLEYVAFVESGTNTTFPNMAPWENTGAADAAWNNAQPAIGNWQGFIAEVINGGLAPTDDVELIIRASTPPGLYVSVTELDSTLQFAYLGTDAWNPIDQNLFADHQGLRNLGSDNSSLVFNEVADEYFTNLDNDILSDVKDVEQQLTFSIQPNPTDGAFQVKYALKQAAESQVNLYDITGQLIYTQTNDFQTPGQHSLLVNLPDGLLKNGMYLVEIVGTRESGVQKLMVVQ